MLEVANETTRHALEDMKPRHRRRHPGAKVPGYRSGGYRLAFRLGLGEPRIHIAGVPLYAHPAFFLWWFWFDAYAPRIFLEGVGIPASG
jgi:hypothetical protein